MTKKRNLTETRIPADVPIDFPTLAYFSAVADARTTREESRATRAKAAELRLRAASMRARILLKDPAEEASANLCTKGAEHDWRVSYNGKDIAPELGSEAVKVCLKCGTVRATKGGDV
jgi:hypothetical protein